MCGPRRYPLFPALEALHGLLACLLLMVWLDAPAHAQSTLQLDSFTGYPQFSQAKLSHDGEHLAITTRLEAFDRIAILGTDDLKPVATFNTDEHTGVANFWWANDERIVLSTYRRSGWLDTPALTGDLFAFNIDDSSKFPIAGPAAGDYAYYTVLDDLPEEDNFILVLRKDIESRAGFGTIARSRARALRLNIYDKPRSSANSRIGRDIFRNGLDSPQEYGDMMADQTGEVRLAYNISEEGKVQAMLHAENGDWRPLPEFQIKAEDTLLRSSGQLIGFTKDQSGLYMINAGSKGTDGLFMFNLESGLSTEIYSHEKYDIDASDLVWTADETEIIGVKFVGALPETHYFSQHPEVELHKRIDASFQNHLVQLYSFTKDGKKALAVIQSDQRAPALFLLNRETNQLLYITSSYPALAPEQMARVDPFVVTARDGTVLEGYVTVPGNNTEPLPMIVIPHGGPFGVRDSFLFDPELQLLASRGYAVLQVNFRGSAGYGAAFTHSGIGNWGGSMVDDVVDAVRWAVNEKIAEADNICIYGGSYGGYSALMAAARYPDLFQCAVGYAGVYDLNLMSSKGDVPFVPWGENFLTLTIGNDPQVLTANSPVNLTDRISAAVFIIHGGQDQRAPVAHAESLRKAMDRSEKSYEWMMIESEGHGFANPENRLTMYTRLLEFFDKHLH